jgi:predicted DNA repair protein MutK
MSTGLIALLDDVVAIAKLAAASADDVMGQAAKAGSKSAGLIIDDAAVTPRYVTGLEPSRELPIIRRIAVGSVRNKLLVLLPAALLLSLVAPWAITPLLMLGGAFLSYEGAEKIYEAVLPHEAHGHEAKVRPEKARATPDPRELEDKTVTRAIRTDFILSAEIMFIALSTIPDVGFGTRATVLAIVGLGITALVYGAVALLVKLDDIGLALARAGDLGLARRLGRGIVAAMPALLKTLSIVGTAAMLWVGGGILVHGLAVFGLDAVEHAIHGLAEAAAHAAPTLPAVVGWLASALGSGLVGLAAGALLIPVVGKVLAPAWARLAALRG